MFWWSLYFIFVVIVMIALLREFLKEEEYIQVKDVLQAFIISALPGINLFAIGVVYITQIDDINKYISDFFMKRFNKIIKVVRQILDITVYTRKER